MAYGSAAISDTSPKFGDGCIYLPNSSSYYQTTTNLSDYAFPTSGLFCVEFFAKIPTITVGEFLRVGSSGAAGSGLNIRLVAVGSVNYVEISVYNGSTLVCTSSSVFFSTNWTYVNVLRDNTGKLRLSANGVSLNYISYTTAFDQPTAFKILSQSSSRVVYVDELRVSKGQYRAYSVPVAEFSAYKTSSESSHSSSSRSSSRSSSKSSSSRSSSRSSVSSSSSSRSSASSSSSMGPEYGYVFGGYYNNSTNISDQTYQYDSSANSWTTKTAMVTGYAGPAASTYVSTAYIYGGKILELYKTTQAYTSSSDSWANKTNLPSPARYLSASCTLSSDGYVFGGASVADIADVDCFSYSGNSWTSKTDMSYARSSYGGACVLYGEAYVIGSDTSSVSYSNSAYNSSLNSWTDKSNVPAPLTAAVLTLNSKGYTLGGYRQSFAKTTYEYSSVGDSWASKTDIPSPYRAGVAGSAIFGKGYVYGGDYKTDTDEYNPSGDSWANKADMSRALHVPAAATLYF